MSFTARWVCPTCRKHRRTILAWVRKTPPSCAHLGTIRHYAPREPMVKR